MMNGFGQVYNIKKQQLEQQMMMLYCEVRVYTNKGGE
jgi:hypothetical protein